ncbi:MAG: transposase [Syntrophales bacterium]|jgi:REP element-mobilizing transposase RayT|nr:transposase [Syntrophales bacterium]MCK9527455.1 transposase [Syntrophales bacterium]MDX9921559.1 transposase [Syntrophales bacterium]
MPRKPRIDAPGTLHHVIARGIAREEIFRSDRDRASFLDRLEAVLEETETACYAWALIPNHFHLLLRTGTVPLSTAMRSLMTGHAVSFNRRHGRCGHLFQNRYRSIICQEDAYFFQLVRYIHLNPLRAGIVDDMDGLSRYPFSGHSVLMGTHTKSWQESEEVLAHFGETLPSARRNYRDFVLQGIDQGRRSDLTGGGLLRSAGGWTPVRESGNAGRGFKTDERILGDSDFVARVLATAQETFDRRHSIKSRGISLDVIVTRVAELLDMAIEDVVRRGRFKDTVSARSLVCYLAVRELGMTMTSLAEYFAISTVAISKSVRRGGEIIKERGIDTGKLIS